MTLPDLPESQNEYQAALFAKAYADSIVTHPRMRQLRLNRIKAADKQAPSWFIRMVDVEIDNVLYRLDYLSRWGFNNDPRHYATDTLQFIRVTHDMLLNFLNPDRMYFSGVKRAEAWLAGGERESVKVDTLKENNSVA
ncbi:hypothetical protein [Morganella morganii]|uniref:hypothetical protein n=1 Tax=Morganella morganii TaxID=582 RepID=UPI001BDAF6E1|nr:hypothetical protein [Morganella morganii]MBT0422315.1 hypothetical protein [Morganella morganii subsp. morganii]MBT0517034.1 hypothetical protein [Morganella morganii subsp. morganii]QWM05391.1 hypothetical protein IZ185_06700 [Morganella morganii subsp. morganii]